MVQESLARRFKPAGFEQPEGSRQNYTKPSPELQEAFYQWIYWANINHNCPDRYGKARELIEPLGEIHADEATSLLIEFKPKLALDKYAGLFISACYNRSPEQVIVFDLEVEDIFSLGIKLKRGKILVNNGKVGKWFGAESSGVVVNNGKAGDRLSQDSLGIAVNNGESGDYFGRESSGVVLNVGETGGLFAFDSSGIVLNIGKSIDFFDYSDSKMSLKPTDIGKIPELKNYLEELSEITKAIKDEETARRFLERYGKMPRERIEMEIKELLRKVDGKF